MCVLIFLFTGCGHEKKQDFFKGTVSEIAEMPIAVNADMDPYLMHLGGFSEGAWMYEIIADVDIPDGTYNAEIVTQSVSPMSFILNSKP